MIFMFRRKVKYYETDRMGIVHHSNYVRWLEEARIDLLEQIGLPYSRMEAEGILIPVLGVSCTYQHPARFDETVSIESQITAYNGLRFSVTYTVKNAETGELCCTGSSEHCFTTPNLRPVRLNRTRPEWDTVFRQAMA